MWRKVTKSFAIERKISYPMPQFREIAAVLPRLWRERLSF
jgi:hypothetical protein